MKVGLDYHYGHLRSYTNETSDDVAYTMVRRLPAWLLSATYYAAPYVTYFNVPAELGFYAQDKWTLRRLTS